MPTTKKQFEARCPHCHKKLDPAELKTMFGKLVAAERKAGGGTWSGGGRPKELRDCQFSKFGCRERLGSRDMRTHIPECAFNPKKQEKAAA